MLRAHTRKLAFCTSIFATVLYVSAALATGLEDFNAAYQAAERGNFGEAIRLYTRAIASGQLSPQDSSSALNNRGHAWSRKNDWDKAIADYNEALRINPQYATALGNRGTAWSKKKAWDRAIVDYNTLLRIDPRNANALNSRCWARAVSGVELGEALLDCTESLRLRPNDSATLDSRGLVNLKLGQYRSSAADYNAALQNKNKPAHPLYGRGLAKRLNGDLAGGDADITVANSLDVNVANQYEGYDAPGIPKSEVRAAAEAGEADAQYQMGLKYELGSGVPKSIPRATDWYRKAANQGHEVAQKALVNLSASSVGRAAPAQSKRHSQTGVPASPATLSASSGRSYGVPAGSSGSAGGGSSGCPRTLAHLASQMPVYNHPSLQNVRNVSLAHDIQNQLTTARAKGTSAAQLAGMARASWQQAEANMPIAEQCIRITMQDGGESMLRALKNGTYNFSSGSIPESCAGQYVLAYYQTVVMKGIAEALACWATSGG